MMIEQGQKISELFRRLNNIIRVGKVIDVDYKQAKASVKIGNIKTDFLPWLSNLAGDDRSWNPLSIGEQVIVLSPTGNLGMGIILPSIYQNSAPAPNDSSNKHLIVFRDGTSLEYDNVNKTLSVDTKGIMTINAAQNVKITAQKANIDASEVNITASTTTIDGNLSVTGQTLISGSATLAGGGIIAGAAITGSATVDGRVVACVGDGVAVSGSTHKGSITG